MPNLYLEEAAVKISKNPQNAKQMEFVMCKAPFVLFSGGVGGGKTAALIWRALALSSDSPYFGNMAGNVGLIGRYSMTSFMKTTYNEMKKWMPKSWIRKYHKKDGILELKNDSVIHFTHFDDMEHLHSYNIGWCAIDQLEQVPEHVFDGVAFERIRLTELDRRDRYGRKLDPPPRLDYHTVFATCNPKRGWVYDRFVLNEEYKDSNDPDILEKYDPEYKIIQVATAENIKHLPKDFVDRQKRNMTEREFKRRSLGHWDAFEGQIYVDFNERLILKDNKVPSPHWDIYVGIDHGGTGSVSSSRANNITAVVFIAVKESPGEYPFIHVFDELTLESSTIEETVAAIDGKLKAIAVSMKMHYPEAAEMIGERPNVRAWRCDPSMNKRGGDTTETIMESYMRNATNRGFNMPLAPGDNSVESGIEKVSWIFRRGLIRINQKCKDFRESHEVYEYGNNGKPAKGQFDHHPDATRYIFSALSFWFSDFNMPGNTETIQEKEIKSYREKLKQQDVIGDGLDLYLGAS